MGFLNENGVARLWQHITTRIQDFITEARANQIANTAVTNHNVAEDAHPDIRELIEDASAAGTLIEEHNLSDEAHQDIRDMINTIQPDRANMYLKRVGTGDWTYDETTQLYTYRILASEHGCGENAFVFDVAQTTENGTFASVMQDGEVDELGNVTIKLTEPMNGKVVISGILSEFEAPTFISNIVASDENNDGNVVFESYTTDPEIDFVNEHVSDFNNPHQVTAALINALDMVDMGTIIPNGSDLNTYTEAGVYRGISSTVSDTENPLINYPDPNKGYGFKMYVIKGYGGTNYTHQFILHGGSSRLYYRLGRSGTWYDWTRLDNAYTYGTSEPSSSMGVNGDLYIQYTE